MEQLVKRISYLHGLMDGYQVDQSSKEGQVLAGVLELLDDVVHEMSALQTRVEEYEEYVEAVDEDLNNLEMELYGDEDDLYEMVDEDDCLTDDDDRYYDLDDSEDAYVFEVSKLRNGRDERSYEFECPSCGEWLFFHEKKEEDGFHRFSVEPITFEIAPINPTS